jgi:hypothetical protein
VGLAQHRHRQQLLRLDETVRRPLDRKDLSRLIDVVNKNINDVDVVCIEDHGQGVNHGGLGRPTLAGLVLIGGERENIVHASLALPAVQLQVGEEKELPPIHLEEHERVRGEKAARVIQVGIHLARRDEADRLTGLGHRQTPRLVR